MKSFLFFAALALTACGSLELRTGDAVKKDAKPAEAAAKSVTFNGSVGYAFELTVNGQKYSDIESYYTAESQALLEKVLAAGHNADAVEYAGKLGFADFIEDMTVFVASSSGSQGRGKVDSHGNFAVEVPNLGKPAGSFKVRATKRVQVVLFNGGVATEKLCYNFSAVEKDVVENPIALGNFATDFTLYDCEQVTDGLKIPEAAAAPATVRNLEACGHVENMWINGNEFVIAACEQQRKYALPHAATAAPYALGESETTATEPEGFRAFAQVYGTDNKFVVPVGSDSLYVTDYGDSASVSLVRGNVVLKSFSVPFGLAFFAVDGNRVFATARLPRSNTWKVGQLDLSSNRFLPHADAPSALTISAAGVIDGNYALISGNKVSFFAF